MKGLSNSILSMNIQHVHAKTFLEMPRQIKDDFCQENALYFVGLFVFWVPLELYVRFSWGFHFLQHKMQKDAKQKMCYCSIIL